MRIDSLPMTGQRLSDRLGKDRPVPPIHAAAHSSAPAKAAPPSGVSPDRGISAASLRGLLELQEVSAAHVRSPSHQAREILSPGPGFGKAVSAIATGRDVLGMSPPPVEDPVSPESDEVPMAAQLVETGTDPDETVLILPEA